MSVRHPELTARGHRPRDSGGCGPGLATLRGEMQPIAVENTGWEAPGSAAWLTTPPGTVQRGKDSPDHVLAMPSVPVRYCFLTFVQGQVLCGRDRPVCPAKSTELHDGEASCHIMSTLHTFLARFIETLV